MMKIFRNKIYYIIFIFLILFYSDTYSQLIENKEFRLKETKSNIIDLSLIKYNITKPLLFKKSAIAKNSSPFLAGMLSFIIPGAALGQLYNKQYVNFAIRFGISTACVLGILITGLPVSESNGNNAFVPLSLLFAANWITSVIDAVIYNKNNLSSK